MTEEALLARPEPRLDGAQVEPSVEYEAKKARFEVDLEAEAAMKSGEKQLGRNTAAERDEIGMASGQPPGKKGRRDTATRATEVESGQPQIQLVDHQTDGTTRSADYLNILAEAEMKAVDDQCFDMDDPKADDLEDIHGRVVAVLIGPPEVEVKEEWGKHSVPKKLEHIQQMSQRRHRGLDKAGGCTPASEARYASGFSLAAVDGRAQPGQVVPQAGTSACFFRVPPMPPR